MFHGLLRRRETLTNPVPQPRIAAVDAAHGSDSVRHLTKPQRAGWPVNVVLSSDKAPHHEQGHFCHVDWARGVGP